MATPVTTASDYCSLLVKSKLLPPEEVDSLYKSGKKKEPEATRASIRFAASSLAAVPSRITRPALVQLDRTDGFFIGGYKILDQVGKGHMGGVYKAVHNSGQIVALKILPASKAKNTHILGRFQRERGC